jgi:O-antigen/teichoic acid export membrane protein
MLDRLAQLPTGKRIVKNFLSLAVANIVSRLIGFVTIAYLARILNASGFGQISFAQSIIAYFTLLSNLGLNTFGIREVARHKEHIKKYVNNILTLRLILAIISFALLLIFLLFINKPTEYKTLIAFYGLSLFPTVFFLNWVFEGVERMEYVGIANILRSLTYAGLVFIFVNSPSEILSVPLFALVASFIMIALPIYCFVKHYGWFTPSFNWRIWKEFLITALPMGLSSIMISIYIHMDTLILGFMKGDEVVGWYNAAYKTILVITSFGGLFIQAIFPAISRYYKDSREKLSLLVNSSAKLLTSVAIPLGIGGTLLAKPIMNFIYGSQYQDGVIAFQILVWNAAVIFISVNFGNSLMACDRQRRYALGVSIGAVTNTILNLLLIPHFSLEGAAIATLVTEVVVLLYMAYHFNRICRIYLERYLLKPSIAALIMGVVLWTVRVNVLFAIIIGIAVYVASFFLIRGMNSKDIQLIRKYIFGRPAEVKDEV